MWDIFLTTLIEERMPAHSGWDHSLSLGPGLYESEDDELRGKQTLLYALDCGYGVTSSKFLLPGLPC